MKLRNYRPEDCAEMARLFYDTVHTVNTRDYPPEQLAVWATGKVDLEVWNRSWIEENPDRAFLDFIRSFPTDGRQRVLDLLEQYAEKKILVFHTREEADDYLRRCVSG